MKMLVFFLLTVAALIFYSRHSSKVFEFILFGLFVIIIYAIATDDFHNIFIANFQFYKVTQWMKFFGVIAVLGFGESFLFRQVASPVVWRYEYSSLLFGAIICWVVILKFNQYLPYRVPFEIFAMKEKELSKSNQA